MTITCNPNSVIMLAPTLQALIGFTPLLPGSGGINLESVGWSCDMEEEGSAFDLQSGKLSCNKDTSKFGTGL